MGMNYKKRLLTRKERAYIIQRISNLNTYKEEFGKLSKKEEGNLINSIIGKIQAPQELGG